MTADTRLPTPWCTTVVGALLIVGASSVSLHGQGLLSFVGGVAKDVALDPTTYAPAVAGWSATRLDWQSSQVFFDRGWVEDNARFTVSGRPHDVAVGYRAGNRRILADAVDILEMSALGNISGRAMERWLTRRFPTRRRLLNAVGLIQRSALASYWSYRLSAGHLRQWRKNDELARQLDDK